MNLIGWNCRGLGKPRSVRCLRDLVKSRHPDFLFLSETMVQSNKIKDLSEQMGFASSYAVERVGQGGGLAIMWRRNVICTVISASSNFIDLEFYERNATNWRLTCFYGFSERHKRKDSWNLLRKLASVSHLPWCIFGDFNDLLYKEDKAGKHPHPQSLMNGFRNAIEDCNLAEIDLVEGQYTWEKSKGSPEWVRERLDRAFATQNWWHKFPLCRLSVVHTVVSDHDPICLELCSVAFSKKSFKFKFENVWLKEPNFHAEVTRHWKSLPVTHLLPKLISISSFMAEWGHKFFHKFRDKVKRQKGVIDDLVNRTDAAGVESYFKEKEKLHDLLLQEEVYWKQRAKVFWLAEGDLNTKFFHAQASMRKRANHVPYLINETGDRIDSPEEMCEIVKLYYQGVFGSSVMNHAAQLEESEAVVTRDQNAMLVAELTFEEFEAAVKQMHPDKAAGPDGLNAAFYQHFWGILGKDVFLCCKNWLKDVTFPAELNDTNLVLIPKKATVERMQDLRPIALCNVMYKILAKVLANRLKQILPDIISENQSAFVPGRNISDNVLIAFETIHSMKQKKSGSEGGVALKLDISKAYDRVDWRYLQRRLKSMGFDDKFVKWMMLCVTTVEYSICFNGKTVGPISPKRGLRQGDPISPYLFLLCV